MLHGASSVVPEYVAEINKYGGDMAGAQGVPEDMLRKAASMAVCKINIDSDIRLAVNCCGTSLCSRKPDSFRPEKNISE